MGSHWTTRGAHAAAFLALALAAACAGASGRSRTAAPHPVTADERARTATAADWEGTPHARLEELFVGRFPGVRVLQDAGGLQIRIRGQSSINGSTQPLFIVDGMPYEGSNGLVSLNPQDVAKIEVLKDIGQTAFYGVRGANGVVLITTKRPGR